MIKKRGLGKGLDAIISNSNPEPDTPQTTPIEIPIEEIKKNPYQPRVMKEDSESLNELANSIKSNGVIQPILVRSMQKGYQLVAGERRLRASKLAGLNKIPAIIISISDEKLLEYAIVENVQREDLNAIEEAVAYNRLHAEFGYTQDEIAEKVGKNRTTVTNCLRLLKLPRDMQQDITNGRISAGHARAILMLENELLQKKLRDAIVSRNLSVRQAEILAGELSKKKGILERIKTSDPTIANMENKLLQFFGVKTKIIPKSKNSGKIEIFYNNLDEFEKILEALNIDEE